VVEFATAVHLSESPIHAGQRLREALGITIDEQFDWRDEWQAWREWRRAVENAGVLVGQFPKVPLTEVRGVSLLHWPLPAIGINSKETSPGARSFTLIHELTHIALARGNEEQVALRERRDETAWRQVERFGEEVASTVLIPEEALSGFLDRMAVPRGGWDIPLVRRLAGTFRVTPLAMATRLRAAGALSWDGYRQWREDWDRHVASIKPRASGFASPVDKALSRGGRPFAQLVLQALDANRITSVDASHYLGLRFDHVENLRRELGRTASRGGGDDDGE